MVPGRAHSLLKKITPIKIKVAELHNANVLCRIIRKCPNESIGTNISVMDSKMYMPFAAAYLKLSANPMKEFIE